MGAFRLISFFVFTILFNHSKKFDFPRFQNYRLFTIYFICFLTDWSLSKNHSFSKKKLLFTYMFDL